MVVMKKFNYSKEDFSKKVIELTNGKGVPVVTRCRKIKIRKISKMFKREKGMMISFGNASGPRPN
ncbi:MAG: hypothetical protein CM1200mP13_11700 [Candidatus Pelagibacterales bacterium]|nr:MAG: hypothetical protein CM1200mP13_11700 [Pelagibacterales bacterium]